MNIPLLIVIVYIFMLYAISWYATKFSSKGGALGYLLAGRGLPAALVSVMVAGLAIGGSSTVGVAERAYKVGLSAGMYNAAWATGAIIVGLVAAGKMRSMNITTITELFGRYYTKTGQVIGVIGQLIIQLTIVALQYVAGGAILTALLPQYFTFNSGMFVTAIVFVGITLIGGYWAAGLSNLINVIVIYFGIILGVGSAVSNAGGFSNIAASLPAGAPWFSWTEGVGLVIVVAWFVTMTTQAFTSQSCSQVTFAARDAKTARNGFIIGGLLILPVGFLSAMFGIIAAAQYPGLEKAALALPTVVMSLNPFIAGITLAGLWAADVSTAVGILLGVSTLVMQDVVNPLLKSEPTQQQGILRSRIVVLVVSVVTYIMAMQVRSILGTIMLALSMLTAYTVILLFSIYAPRLCKRSSATITLLAGILTIFVWNLFPSSHIVPDVVFLEWIVCVITFLAVGVIDKNVAPLPEDFSNESKTAA